MDFTGYRLSSRTMPTDCMHPPCFSRYHGVPTLFRLATTRDVNLLSDAIQSSFAIVLHEPVPAPQCPVLACSCDWEVLGSVQNRSGIYMRYNASHFFRGNALGAHDDCCERSALLTNRSVDPATRAADHL